MKSFIITGKVVRRISAVVKAESPEAIRRDDYDNWSDEQTLDEINLDIDTIEENE